MALDLRPPMNLKGQDREGEVSTLATAPEEILVSPPVGGPTLTALQVLSPMVLNLKGEESEDREGEVSPCNNAGGDPGISSGGWADPNGSSGVISIDPEFG
jgi:hypothetical protein